MTWNMPFHPYTDETRNFLYNLLFCDSRELFRPGEGEPSGGLAEILAEHPRIDDLRYISDDEDEESRYRALAYNRLREMGLVVPVHILLGTIIEVSMPEGLDALAVFADGRVRYLNHAGPPVIFETAPPPVADKADEVLAASQPIVERIGPWGKPRLPPPPRDHARLTFLVSDGLYFGEGPFATLAHDQMSAPLIRAAGELLGAVVDTAMKK